MAPTIANMHIAALAGLLGLSAAASADAADLLTPLRGHAEARVCWYGGSQLRASSPFTNGVLESSGQTWTCRTESVPQDGGDCADLRYTFKLEKGEAAEAGVAVAFDFDDWTLRNHVLVPAVLYGGNRFRIYPVGYPPFIHNEKDRPLDMPVTTTDIPHLNPDGSAAKVEMMTGNCATPMMSFFSPDARRGFILLTEQGTRFGNSGMTVREDAGKRQGGFVVSAPCVRETRYHMCGRGGSGDHGAAWKAGDELTLRFRLYSFPCPDLATFYDKVFSVRKALSGACARRNVAPYSTIADLIVGHFDRDKWFQNETYGYYCNSRDNNHKYNNQIGWSGNPVYSYPAALLTTTERARRVGSTLDMLTRAQGESGLFFAMFQKGAIHGDAFTDDPSYRSIAMVRRTGETVLFGLRTLELIKSRGEPVKPEWEAMFRRASDALVKLYGTYGQFGQFVNADTGTMFINGSTAGGVNVTALAAASAYFKEPRYLAVAEEAGRLYDRRDLSNGYVGGGPAEILQSPDSEAAYNLVEACTTLYELTRKPEWLDRARRAAALFSTWMVSYDYEYPKGSSMERAGARAAGAVFASSQNNHAAPGIYISSAEFLLRLYRATSDPRIADLYLDTVHNIVQYVNTKTNPIMGDGGAHEGYVTERVQLSDWEGGGIGHVPLDSNMAWETLAALSCLENPGIYVRTDADVLLVPDHIEASVTERNANGVTLKLSNPTPSPASVSILAEDASMCSQPLARSACLKWPRVQLAPGQTRMCNINRSGEVEDAK